MRINLLSEMHAVELRDRDGRSACVDVKAFQDQDTTHVFLSDPPAVGASSVARNCAIYIAQLVERFDFPIEETQFYRHIYIPDNGSLFGRFNLTWEQGKLTAYTFSMLNVIDEGQNIHELIERSDPVEFSYAQMKDIAIAG